MIDIALLRKDAARIGALLKKKEPSVDIDGLLALDVQVREIRVVVESMRKEKNDLAASASKGLSDENRARSIEIGRQLKEKELELAEIESRFQHALLFVPNIPMDGLPEGGKESNLAIRSFGEKPEFLFSFKNHMELNQKLGWFDFEAGTQMAGAQFPCYTGDGVKVIYALTRIMLRNNAQHGFQPVIPPAFVNRRSLVNASSLPKFEGDFYQIEADGLYPIPTAEVPLTNLYAGKIFEREELPVRMTAWTSCFRREAGGYGSLERGLIRIHQFEKVELYAICDQENSVAELERMVECAETLLKMLGLHYQVSLLAGQDCSYASAKTYDIEVWLPGQNRYYEVSSCSNCTDFQARRAEIRYRPEKGGKPSLVHTLNASSLALPRLMVALMECYQQPDGSVKLPKVLQDEMDALW
jgi:seryl-tRNA synthetase